VWEQAIETLQQLDAVRHRIKKLEKHLQIAQLHVRMIQSELGFKEEAPDRLNDEEANI
jgi:hypothetical protein